MIPLRGEHSAQPGKRVLVKLRSGRVLEGKFVEKGSTYIVLLEKHGDIELESVVEKCRIKQFWIAASSPAGPKPALRVAKAGFGMRAYWCGLPDGLGFMELEARHAYLRWLLAATTGDWAGARPWPAAFLKWLRMRPLIGA